MTTFALNASDNISKEIGLVGNLFCISGSDNADHAALQWSTTLSANSYSDGKALVITGTPGGQFTVHHVYNPLNIQVRDMAIFFDDDGTGYLIAAANKEGQGANATIYIFKMNDDYSDVTKVVKTLHEDQYREFPNLIKRDGYYFLFTFQAAGWYPSSGAYTVTDNLYGEWSELRSIGNTSTFSSQSGWIVNLNDKNYLMHAYRWLRANSTSGTTLCPLYFDNGFAFYDYYPSFRYSTKTGDLFPVQQGDFSHRISLQTLLSPLKRKMQRQKLSTAHIRPRLLLSVTIKNGRSICRLTSEKFAVSQISRPRGISAVCPALCLNLAAKPRDISQNLSMRRTLLIKAISAM